MIELVPTVRVLRRWRVELAGQEAGEDAERRVLTVANLAMREGCKAWGGELAGD